MKKLTALVVSLAALCGCFENKTKPQDLPMATSLAQLASMDAAAKASLGRVILRADAAPIPDGFLDGVESLVTLDISERRLSEVPKDVYSLKSLRELYLAYNSISSVPDAVFAIDGLAYLNLDCNRIGALPAAIGGAKDLRWLRLNTNRLSALPPEIASLGRLQRVYLRDNLFKAVPEELKDMPLLEDIDLSGNREISEFPAWLCDLPKLHNLSLADTGIAKLPGDLSGLKDLKSLELHGCPLPPGEIKRVRAALPDVSIVF